MYLAEELRTLNGLLGTFIFQRKNGTERDTVIVMFIEQLNGRNFTEVMGSCTQ